MIYVPRGALPLDHNIKILSFVFFFCNKNNKKSSQLAQLSIINELIFGEKKRTHQGYDSRERWSHKKKSTTSFNSDIGIIVYGFKDKNEI